SSRKEARPSDVKPAGNLEEKRPRSVIWNRPSEARQLSSREENRPSEARQLSNREENRPSSRKRARPSDEKPAGNLDENKKLPSDREVVDPPIDPRVDLRSNPKAVNLLSDLADVHRDRASNPKADHEGGLTAKGRAIAKTNSIGAVGTHIATRHSINSRKKSCRGSASLN
ncbi:MAG: hypothetical protein ACYC6N_08475, partial [Pirellulaceae bacterium]